MIGAILTNQYTTQIIQAIYFVFIDFVLFGQWVFFFFRNRRLVKVLEDPNSPNIILIKDSNGGSQFDSTDDLEQEPTSITRVFSMFGAVFVLILLGNALLMMWSSSSSHETRSHGLRKLLAFESSERKGDLSTKDAVGLAFAWISAVLYLGSRAPQIVKNCRRRSTEGKKELSGEERAEREKKMDFNSWIGLALLMFVCAVCGNVTYSVSVLLRSPTWDDLWPNRFPFIVGTKQP